MKKILIISILAFAFVAVPFVAEGFYDVQYGHPNYTAITYLNSYGRLNGFTGGGFRPNEEINRASFVAMVTSVVSSYRDESEYENCYKDTKNKWYEDEVCYAKEHDWLDDLKISGKRFKPGQKISAGEAMSIVNNAFDVYGRDLEDTLTGALRRGEAAQMIYEAVMDSNYALSYTIYPQYHGQYYYYPNASSAPSGYYSPPVYYTSPANYYTPPSYYYTPPTYYNPPIYVPPGYMPPI